MCLPSLRPEIVQELGWLHHASSCRRHFPPGGGLASPAMRTSTGNTIPAEPSAAATAEGAASQALGVARRAAVFAFGEFLLVPRRASY